MFLHSRNIYLRSTKGQVGIACSHILDFFHSQLDRSIQTPGSLRLDRKDPDTKKLRPGHVKGGSPERGAAEHGRGNLACWCHLWARETPVSFQDIPSFNYTLIKLISQNPFQWFVIKKDLTDYTALLLNWAACLRSPVPSLVHPCSQKTCGKDRP